MEHDEGTAEDDGRRGREPADGPGDAQSRHDMAGKDDGKAGDERRLGAQQGGKPGLEEGAEKALLTGRLKEVGARIGVAPAGELHVLVVVADRLGKMGGQNQPGGGVEDLALQLSGHGLAPLDVGPEALRPEVIDDGSGPGQGEIFDHLGISQAVLAVQGPEPVQSVGDPFVQSLAAEEVTAEGDVGVKGPHGDSLAAEVPGQLGDTRVGPGRSADGGDDQGDALKIAPRRGRHLKTSFERSVHDDDDRMRENSPASSTAREGVIPGPR